MCSPDLGPKEAASGKIRHFNRLICTLADSDVSFRGLYMVNGDSNIRRLGKNAGGYYGEAIDIQSVLARVKTAALAHGWHRDTFMIPNGAELIAYRRNNPAGSKRVYLSTGIHGDEPAGPVAILELLEESHWPESIDVWLCPCLNLTGFPLNKRENAMGVDLNRDYRHMQTPETRSHVAWLRAQPSFDIAVCLHEDWEANGYYLYELNPDNRPSLAHPIIESVSRVCPIESGETVDGWPVQGGIIRPKVQPEERPQWPESLFLLTYKTRQSYTLEAPSDFPLAVRVAAHKAAVRTVLEAFDHREFAPASPEKVSRNAALE